MFFKQKISLLPVNLIIDIGSKNLKFFIYSIQEEQINIEYYYQIEHGVNFSFIKGFDSKKLLNIIVEVLEVLVDKFSFELRQLHVSLADELVIIKRKKVSFNRSKSDIPIDLGELKNLIHKSQWKITNEVKAFYQEINPDTQIKLLTSQLNSIVIDTEVVSNPVGLEGEIIQFDFINAYVNPEIYELFLEVFNSLDISLSSVLINMFSYTNLKPESELLFIDLGAKVTNLCLLKDEKFEYIKSYDFGVDIVTEEIAQNLKITLKEAEELLINYSQNNFNKIDFYTFRKAVLSGCKKLISSLNIANVKFQKVKLFGGGSHIPEFTELLLLKFPGIDISQFNFSDFSYLNKDFKFDDLSALNCLNLASFVNENAKNKNLNQILNQVIKLMQL